MEPNDSDPGKLHNLDDLDRRLYRRENAHRKPRRFDSLFSNKPAAPRIWKPLDTRSGAIEKVASHPTLFRKFFFWALAFAGIAALFAVIVFFTGGNTVSNSNIDISVLGNSFTAGGDQLSLQVEVANKNSTPIELADLFIEYDKGGDSSGGATHVRDRMSLGTIGPGKKAVKTIFVTLYGQENEVKNVDFTLQYRIRSSNAIFVKTYTFPVTISSAPIALSVDAPASISPNQTLTMTVKVRSNAKDTVSKMLLRVDYPSGFQFQKASVDPSSFNNVWDLGDIAPGAERDITITGLVYGQDGEDRAFHIYTGAASDKDAAKIGITYNALLEVVTLVKPFIAAHLSINGSDSETVPVPAGSGVHVSVAWANNLPTRVTDAEITVALSGNALDTTRVSAAKGFYDSSKGTIVWNKTTDSELGAIEPSDSGTLDFTFEPLPLWGAGSSLLVRPSIKLSVSIKGKDTESGGTLGSVSDFEEKTAVVSSDLGFSANAFHFSGPFSNTGPVPPKAGQPTTYTITWTLTDSANALSDALVTATLPTYVEWVGTHAPSSETIEYDSTTSTVRWRAGIVAAGAGLSGAAKSVSFQVRLNPSTSQVGSTPKLVLDAAISARDTFTGETLSLARPPLSTRLDNDPGFPAGGEVVTN